MTQLTLIPREGRSAKDYALMYAGFGWKVFPVWHVMGATGARVCACLRGAGCDRPGKHPIADLAPNGLKDASSERAKIEAWWGQQPDASVGIATGEVSGITVIDADAGEGKPGLINLTRLCAPNGGVPSTFCVETGGGGLHLYFKYNAALRTGVNVLDEAIDVRSDGGYVIAPPSLHVRGVYKWREDRAELKEVPGWMIAAPAQAAGRHARRRGRPRTREQIPLDRAESMLACIDYDDRDRWLKMGLLLGRMYVGTAAESEAWNLYETWAARSDKFDEDRGANIVRMREQFYEASQQPPRAGAEALGVGTLYTWAKEGGWTPFGDKVVVPYEAGQENEMCDALARALVADADRNRFFTVGTVVHEVVRAKPTSVQVHYNATVAGEPLPEGLIVRGATSAALQSALAARAVLAVTNVRGEPAAKPIPEALATMMRLAHAGEFPSLTGVAGWPLVLGGRVVHRARGYDAETGMYFDIDQRVVLDESLSAEEGWRWIREEMLTDFPFESEKHAAGALAMMLAMMQRPVMKICPAFAVVAPQPGTGKSTLIEASAIGVHGTAIAAHAFSSDEEERRKVLHALMLAKIPAVMFDNIGRGATVASEHFAKAITAENSTDRTLGQSEISTAANSILITFNGNNIAFVRDLASRVVVLRLNARAENPIGRAFRHSDIRAWALEKRARLLSALVAIGRLADGARLAGTASRFEDYDRMIVGPVLRVTGQDVRTLNVEENADAEENAATKEVLAALWIWQQGQREGQDHRRIDGQPWPVHELVAAIAGRAFPEAQVAEFRRWATPDERKWASDPGRTLGYALRAARGDYSFSPYVLTNRPATGDRVEWLIKKDAAQAEEGAATDAF